MTLYKCLVLVFLPLTTQIWKLRFFGHPTYFIVTSCYTQFQQTANISPASCSVHQPIQSDMTHDHFLNFFYLTPPPHTGVSPKFPICCHSHHHALMQQYVKVCPGRFLQHYGWTYWQMDGKIKRHGVSYNLWFFCGKCMDKKASNILHTYILLLSCNTFNPIPHNNYRISG